ncbi:MAG TPA: DUF1697 domain-containing protein [Acidobacteriaceae bacterium]|jgi:uncharacterized protein (DUF1697 family)|nr:DUF1697 domain-containing protein [Acidobacteriaceae bacterium]
MPVCIALLRGINVVGANQLPMKELAALCSGCGFLKARTYIQSGNAIFESRLKEAAIQRKLESALAAKMSKPVAVMVRTPAEMRAVLEANPFADKEPSKVLVAFLAGAMPDDPLHGMVTPGGEQVVVGKREIYVYYPEGMGRSRFRLPLRGVSITMRNINTVGKLVELAEN